MHSYTLTCTHTLTLPHVHPTCTLLCRCAHGCSHACAQSCYHMCTHSAICMHPGTHAQPCCHVCSHACAHMHMLPDGDARALSDSVLRCDCSVCSPEGQGGCRVTEQPPEAQSSGLPRGLRLRAADSQVMMPVTPLPGQLPPQTEAPPAFTWSFGMFSHGAPWSHGPGRLSSNGS